MGGKHTRRTSIPGARDGRGPKPSARAADTEATSPEHASRVAALLHQHWGQAACELDHHGPFQLLVAHLLSLQSRPSAVNQASPTIFARYPDAAALARAERAELEALVRPTGFYRSKAARLVQMAQALVQRHGGHVPDTLGALSRLPGVTRQAANGVLADHFGRSAGFWVNPDVLRTSRRLGLTDAADAADAERDLMAIFPRPRWIDLANELSWLGRRICKRREPACHRCALAPECPSASIDPRPYPWGHGS